MHQIVSSRLCLGHFLITAINEASFPVDWNCQYLVPRSELQANYSLQYAVVTYLKAF